MELKLEKSVLREIEKYEVPEKKYTLLIVDDEEENLSSIVTSLEYDYKCLTASDGEKALELIQKFDNPDHIQLILSDQRMPGLTGVEFLAQTIPIIPHSKRIILTGYTDIDAIIDSINKGQIYRFLTKPITPQDLQVTIKRALETYELEQKNVELVGSLKFLNASLEEQVRTKTAEIREDLEIATDFQNSILPPFPSVPFLRFAHRYSPYGGVSGDTYDFSQTGEGEIGIFLGDATGHGIAAAFMTMMVQIGLDSIQGNLSTHEVLSHLNKLLSTREREEKSVTGVYLRVAADGLLKVAQAGHPPTIVIPSDGSQEYLFKEGGYPLGMFSEEIIQQRPYVEETHTLKHGDKVFIYSDGISEWHNHDNEMFGIERMVQCLKKNASMDLDSILDKLVETAKDFSQGFPCMDDLTIIGFEYQKEEKKS